MTPLVPDDDAGWTSLGVRTATRDKLRRKKHEAEADGLSDDAFLGIVLDSFDPGVKLYLVARRKK